MEFIAQRFACRTFIQEPTKEQDESLQTLIQSLNRATIPGWPKSKLLLTNSDAVWSVPQTIGMVKGPKHWVLAFVDPSHPRSFESTGFLLGLFELECSKLHLNCVILGDTRLAAPFQPLIQMNKDIVDNNLEVVALLCYGIGEKQSSIAASTKERLDWNELFYDGKWGNPLFDKKKIRKYKSCFEAVRLAPSSFNCQPWRIVVSDFNSNNNSKGRRRFDFFQAFHNTEWNRVDLGIAMAYWQFVMGYRQSITGTWTLEEPNIDFIKPPLNSRHIASWIDLSPCL